ncbi:MAG: hypothetical protein HY552_03040 [Elusimicrobia bacterium]|nr:hypothetical protein [Elusimicrobiota bacterium]
MCRLGALALLIVCANEPSRAQENAAPPLLESIQKAQEQSDRARQDALEKDKKSRQLLIVARRQNLESIKEGDPNAYNREKAALERQEQFEAILEDFRAGRLPVEKARTRLRPLMGEQLKGEIAALPERIAQLEKNLASLKRAREKPELFGEQRINELLGQSEPASAADIPPLPPGFNAPPR